MMKIALLLIAAALGNSARSPQTQPASYPPKPAPPIYASQKFGLAMKVPAGLSYCPLPKKWSGLEQGTVLFLQPPSACLDNGATSSSTRLIAGFVPSVTVYYRANAGRYDNFDGDIPPLHTSLELAHQFCPEPSRSDLKLLGEPAFTCHVDLAGNKVRIILSTLYDFEHKILAVTLLTTQERLADDQRIFESLVSAITTCKPASDNTKTELPACPKGTAW